MKDILEIVNEYGLQVVKEGEILRAFCPFHQDTGRPNFTVYKDTDSWFCFACNFGGDGIDFVSRFEGISKRDAIAKLRGETDEWEERQEKIYGLLAEPDAELRNLEVDILVSRLAKEAMQKDPTSTINVIKFLKELDSSLQGPVTFQDEQKILSKAKQILTPGL